jgi:hypothetical protein
MPKGHRHTPEQIIAKLREAEVTMRLVPNPGQTGGDRRTVEHDFRMTGGVFDITMRVCMADYFMHRLELDDADHPESETHQLVLLNRADVEAKMKADGRC